MERDLELFDERNEDKNIDTGEFNSRREVVAFLSTYGYVAIVPNEARTKIDFYPITDETKIRHKKYSYEGRFCPIFINTFVADRELIEGKVPFRTATIDSNVRDPMCVYQKIAIECRQNGMTNAIPALETPQSQTVRKF
ncbi:MAG: hypothetical protein PHY80_00950 [Rickettsiales bacterium]|nr:hypothetical protein [Rickettsiales bacterium]